MIGVISDWHSLPPITSQRAHFWLYHTENSTTTPPVLKSNIKTQPPRDPTAGISAENVTKERSCDKGWNGRATAETNRMPQSSAWAHLGSLHLLKTQRYEDYFTLSNHLLKEF